MPFNKFWVIYVWIISIYGPKARDAFRLSIYSINKAAYLCTISFHWTSINLWGKTLHIRICSSVLTVFVAGNAMIGKYNYPAHTELSIKLFQISFKHATFWSTSDSSNIQFDYSILNLINVSRKKNRNCNFLWIYFNYRFFVKGEQFYKINKDFYTISLFIKCKDIYSKLYDKLRFKIWQK